MDWLDELKNNVRRLPPIVVGCSGGSGSRVLAEVLHRSGCFMGKNLNHAMDNMDFAFCFGGRLSWLKKRFPFKPQDDEARAAIGLFEKVFFRERLSFADKRRLLGIGLGYIGPKAWKLVTSRSPGQRLRSLAGLFTGKGREDVPPGRPVLRWGFKLPGSIMAIAPLLEFYPEMQFIQIIRDGRDIALSDNRKMVTHYAPLFGMPGGYSPRSAYELWSRMNISARGLCASRMKEDKYLIVRFESLCNNPREEVDRIIRFAGLPTPADSSIYSVPRKIPSIGRWRSQAELFKQMDAMPLRLFGYDVGSGVGAAANASGSDNNYTNCDWDHR